MGDDVVTGSDFMSVLSQLNVLLSKCSGDVDLDRLCLLNVPSTSLDFLVKMLDLLVETLALLMEVLDLVVAVYFKILEAD